MLRFGLCCIFRNEPIRFRQTTAKALFSLSEKERFVKLSAICLENTRSLINALETIHRFGIRAFRVSSQFFPRYTHPEVGYTLDVLPDFEGISSNLERVKQLHDKLNIRLSFHPDQFVLLSSPSSEVTRKSIVELDYQATLAEMIGADVINIHGGGVYGDKQSAFKRLCENFQQLPERVKSRLTLENDDSSYTVEDLLPICSDLKIPMVFDAHHHRCNPDRLSIAEATYACIESWRVTKRGEPYFHISSPKNGWDSLNWKPHADQIDVDDFPDIWLGLDATVDVEAKDKEKAIIQLMKQLSLC